MLLEGILVVTKQDTASKDTFFLINLIFQSILRLKISHKKMKNVTRGGGGVRKVPKKCHVLFEWPLIRVGTDLVQNFECSTNFFNIFILHQSLFILLDQKKRSA